MAWYSFFFFNLFYHVTRAPPNETPTNCHASVLKLSHIRVDDPKEVEEMNSVIERIEKNDSKGVYINDDVTVDKKVSTYQYGEESSEKFKSAYISVFFEKPNKSD